MSLEEAEIFRADEVVHRRLRMFLVLLELCRHPLSEEQVVRVDAYASAIGEIDDTGLKLARDLVRESHEEAADHFWLAWSSSMIKLSEAVLLERYERIGAVDPELVAMLNGWVNSLEGPLVVSTSSSIWNTSSNFQAKALTIPPSSLATT